VAVLDYLKSSWLEYAAVINPVMSILTPDNQDSISKHLVKYHIYATGKPMNYQRDFIMVLTRTLDFVIEAKKGYVVENRMQKIKGGTHGNDAS
jgi:alkaline phosphatase D